jgi:heme oxygenase
MHASGSGLGAFLREGTADLHTAAEGQRFQQAMVQGAISREEYGRFLQEVGEVHRAIDAGLQRHAASQPLLKLLVRSAHQRSPRIEEDLAALGLAPRPSEPLGATRSFVAFLEQIGAGDPAALVGVIYVTEGATNGNKFIAKALPGRLGLNAGEALGYLDPHGAEQRRVWMEFKSALETLAPTAAERERILQAARRTFQYFLELSPELDSVGTPRPVGV